VTKLTIVIPAYNELQTIEKVLGNVLSVPLPGFAREVILVDDGSTDGTSEWLRCIATTFGEHADTAEVRIFYQELNQGKGAALRKGFAEASGEIILVQDADLEYSPADYPRLLEPILTDRADVVFGSRFSGGDAHRVLYFWHFVGNKFLTLLSNVLSNLNLTDMECCYKVFRREVLAQLHIEENRFGVEPELTAKVAKLGCRIYEVGVSYSGRTYAEGKKIGWQDGLRALWCILKYNLRP